MKIRTLSAAVVAACCTGNAVAEQLSPIVVTASRMAQTTDETLAPVTIINRSDIETRQAKTVMDALRGTPGVSITNNGGAGKASAVRLRGTESDHVLVLINGIKVGSASLGSASFEHIPIDQVERIEVVRGPRSSLYGSEAIGGVIQIFTRKAEKDLTPQFSLTAASDQTYRLSAGVSGNRGNGWFNVSASAEDSDGFNSCSGDPVTFAGCATIEPDKDGYTNLSGALRGGYKFDNGLVVEAHLLHTDAEVEFDGSFQNSSDTIQQTLGGSLLYPVNEQWDINLTLGRNLDKLDSYLNNSFASRFDSIRHTASLQNNFALNENQSLTLGVDYYHDKVESSTVYAEDERDNWGLFGQYLANYGQHDVQLSLRRDDNEQFGNTTTGGIAWGYALAKDLRLSASYGTAFKAPTFNELYFPFFGNPDLDPETSHTVDFGLKGRHAKGDWSLNLYETRIEDLIGYNTMTFAADNIAKARIRGMEFATTLRLGQWDVSGSLNLMDPRDRSAGATHNNQLPRRAKQDLRIDIDRRWESYQLGATFLAQGKRYDDAFNSREMGAYATMDLRGSVNLDKHWVLQGNVENLFDEDYETASFFNQPGRTFSLTLRYQP